MDFEEDPRELQEAMADEGGVVPVNRAMLPLLPLWTRKECASAKGWRQFRNEKIGLES